MNFKSGCFQIILAVTAMTIIFIMYTIKLDVIKLDVLKSNIEKENTPILIHTKHLGTTSELIGVLSKRNYRYDLLEKSKEYNTQAQAIEICNKYKTIIISDAMLFAREQLKQASDACKNSTIILSITNRFDYSTNGPEDYNLFQKLTQLENVYWVPNNNYELFYLKLKGIYPPESRCMEIDPIGYYFHTKDDQKTSVLNKTRKIAAVVNRSNFYDIFKSDIGNRDEILKNVDSLEPVSYGGSLGLTSYKYFIYLPYQFSTMKVFQNLLENIVMVIPSKTFFQKLVPRLTNVEYAKNSFMDIFKSNPDDWFEYFDIYQNENKNMFITFDTWDDLIDIVTEKRKIDIEKQKMIIKKRVEEHTKECNLKWDKFFKMLDILF